MFGVGSWEGQTLLASPINSISMGALEPAPKSLKEVIIE